MAVLWAGAEECGGGEVSGFIFCPLPAALLMTSTDRNDLMPTHQKLEWVTPKISLMEADKTAGAGKNIFAPGEPSVITPSGPS